MKEGFRQSMSWLHIWLGVMVGWILYFVYLTGTLGYLDKEIDYWMTPDRPFFAEVPPQQQQLALAQRYLQAMAPEASSWTIQLIAGREAPALEAAWTSKPSDTTPRGRTTRTVLDPHTGEPVDYSARATAGGQVLYKMHYYLAYIPQDTAVLFIMACTMVMFAAMVTGVIVHKNIFKDLFTFRPGKGQRSWLDGHNLLSVTSLPFHLMVTYTGFTFFVFQFMPGVPNVIYDPLPGKTVAGQMYEGTYPYPQPVLPTAANAKTPLADLSPLLDEVDARWGKGLAFQVEVQKPGDANARVVVRPQELVSIAYPENALVFDGVTGKLLEDFNPVHNAASNADHVMKGLHKGLFANWFLRVLYVFMGVAGTAMIGTGLLLWSNKRKTRLLAAGKPLHVGIHLVDRLNLGTIIGSPIAIAAYFWANRLLPLELTARAEWEVHCMYLTLAAMFAWPCVRPLQSARVEMAWLGVAAFGLLPVLNAATTQRHLGVSLGQGDWIMAGFDLVSLLCAALFAWYALAQRKREKQSGVRQKLAESAQIVTA